MDLEQIIAELRRVADLDADDLAALESALRDLAADLSVSETTADTVTALQRVADALDVIDTEHQARAEVEQELLAAGTRALDRIGGRPRNAEMRDGTPRTRTPLSAIKVPASMRPPARSAPRARPTAVTAAGLPIDNVEAFAAELAREAEYFAATSQGYRRVASITEAWPEDRPVMRPGIDNMGAVTDALTAAGGRCSPPEVRYAIDTVASTVRPLRAALDSFRADRGALTFSPPPHLVDVLADTTNAALTTITNAEDASSKAKTVQTIACPTSTTVELAAVALRLRFGNLAQHFFSELTSAWVRTALAAHARLAERELFETMRAGSTLVNTAPVELGAWSQYVSTLQLVAEQIRYRHRYSGTVTAVAPSWLPGLLATDLRKRAAGDQVLDVNAEAMLVRACNAFGVSLVFQIDDARTNDANGSGAPFTGAITATVGDFPGRVSTLVFPAGSWLFLDGGSLDVGYYRDSTLIAANQVDAFFESWESAALVGPESLNVSTPLCASGTAAALTTSDCGAIGS